MLPRCDAIVACTGYRNSFPMFEHPDVCDDVVCAGCGCKTKDLNAFGQNPRRLYKQIFCPVFPDGQLAFFGFARPAFGAIPPTAEMQSRFFALVVDGKVKLPDMAGMEAIAKEDQANWEWRFGYDAKRVKGLVLCANQIFNPTSMCAYSNVLTRALPPCFENSLRAIDSSKNQPNRLRFDRAREF